MRKWRNSLKPLIDAAGFAAGWRRPVAPAPGAFEGEIDRIVMWSMNSLGDVLRATPAIRAVRRKYPKAKITFVAAGRAAPILRNNPNIDELVEIPDAYRFRQHVAAVRKLRRAGAGGPGALGVVFEVNATWTAVVGAYLRAVGVRRWVCFDFDGRRVPRGAAAIALGEGAAAGSWIDQFNRLAEAAGATLNADARDMEICFSPAERKSLEGRLAELGLPEEDEKSFFLVHAGANVLEVSRRWSPENFAEVIVELHRRWGWPIALTGMPAEGPIIDSIRAITDAANVPTVSLVGKLSMREMAGVVARAAVVVTNDTGPLHVANALKRPTVAILGPTDPQVVGIPPTTRVVRVELPCSPCAKFAGWKACTNAVEGECLKRVTPAMVVAAVEELAPKCDASPKRSLPVVEVVDREVVLA